MRLISGRRAQTLLEYIVAGIIIVGIIGIALWQFAGAAAQKFNEYKNGL